MAEPRHWMEAGIDGRVFGGFYRVMEGGERTRGVRPVVDFNSFGFGHETGRGMDETPGECRGRGDGRAAHRFGSTRAREDSARRRMARSRGSERQRLLGRPEVGDDAGGGLAGRIGWVGRMPHGPTRKREEEKGTGPGKAFGLKSTSE
jgi:hypothetical protein